MGTGEFYYLCLAIGAMTAFALMLAWANWFTNRPPQGIKREAGE